MQFIKRFLYTVDNINDWTGKSVSYLMPVFVLFISCEVMLRYVVNSPTIWINESVLLVYGAYILLAAGCTLLYNAHIKIDILYSRWPPRTQAIVDIVTSTFFFVFVGVFLWKGAEMAWMSIQHLEHSQSYFRPVVYPTKLSIPIAAFLILLQGVAKLIRDITLAITGERV